MKGTRRTNRSIREKKLGGRGQGTGKPFIRLRLPFAGYFDHSLARLVQIGYLGVEFDIRPERSDISLHAKATMLKLTKKADYGLMAMKHLAEHADRGACSAKEVAESYGIPPEALAKIMQRLVKAGLLVSQHGMHGGYILARDADSISAFEVIRAIDGPLFITSCITVRGECDQSERCTIREPLRRVNDSIEQVLRRIKISHMKEEDDVHQQYVETKTELIRIRN